MKIKLTGVTELIEKLHGNKGMEAVKKIVKANGERMERTMKEEAVFRRHTPMAIYGLYSTGATRKGITGELGAGGFSYTVDAGGTHYASYVEYGTRKMQAQPFVRPAFGKTAPFFIKDMLELVK